MLNNPKIFTKSMDLPGKMKKERSILWKLSKKKTFYVNRSIQVPKVAENKHTKQIYSMNFL